MTRLRLKRLFLLSLVISLTACAVVAIGALLLSQFNQTTGRILGTLVALGFHSGAAMACAASLERQRRAVLSTGGLVLFGVNFAWMMVCIWWPGLIPRSISWSPDRTWQSVMTTGALTLAYVLAIPCADLAHAKRWVPLPQVGLVASLIAFGMLLVCIWAERTGSIWFARLTAVTVVVAFSCAHQCVIGRVRAIPGLKWLTGGAILSLWLMAVLLSLLILGDFNWGDATMRLVGAAGVLDAVATIALVIMAKVKSVEKIEGLESTSAKISLQCPRCSTQQVVEAGASQCGACGLRFRIEIEEPRCAKCCYLLWQLPQRRCPECGTAF